MRRALLCLCLLAPPAAADDAAVAAVLDTAMAEQRLIQTCTGLIPDEGGRQQALWQRNVARTLEVLAAAGSRPANLAVFAASALPGALSPSADTPWSEVVALCSADPDWFRRFQTFEMTLLPQAVEEVLQ